MTWLWPDTARMLRSLLLIAVLLAAVPVAATELSLTYLAASSVALENPHDLKLSPDGRYLYVADVGNNRVAILARISHHPSTAATLCRTLPDFHSVRALNIVKLCLRTLWS
jgi:hypothetical protein